MNDRKGHETLCRVKIFRYLSTEEVSTEEKERVDREKLLSTASSALIQDFLETRNLYTHDPSEEMTTAEATQPTTEKATVEAAEEEESSDDEVPALEGATNAEDAADDKSGKQSRSEKKSRKAMQKLGMKQVNGIVRVTLRRGKNMLFVLSKPDIFKSPASDTYVIFGEAKIEDLANSGAANAVKKFEAADNADDVPELVESGTTAAAASDDGEEVDESGLEAKDISLVMNQASCSRSAAVKALRKSGGDIVNAIIELTIDRYWVSGARPFFSHIRRAHPVLRTSVSSRSRDLERISMDGSMDIQLLTSRTMEPYVTPLTSLLHHERNDTSVSSATDITEPYLLCQQEIATHPGYIDVEAVTSDEADEAHDEGSYGEATDVYEDLSPDTNHIKYVDNEVDRTEEVKHSENRSPNKRRAEFPLLCTTGVDKENQLEQVTET
ncbi:putative nascent polypeptide-associated complex subunit alpha-like protein [Planoprotostelium fungivorum]|uniref:Putative nascent polypeptide-associated complex subunit alpha-like protein n=1 Tax=Planoprotostelium fungivorum TaxID=1890364 RepID=A0A2P6NJD5_9EUKA|nr:putative nascent polypeptide-associated complex subunit alpha-like protein [Planoprotostelium fungivorum]